MNNILKILESYIYLSIILEIYYYIFNFFLYEYSYIVYFYMLYIVCLIVYFYNKDKFAIICACNLLIGFIFMLKKDFIYTLHLAFIGNLLF